MERIRGVLELSDDLTISADEEITSTNSGTQTPAESTTRGSSPSATITSPIASLFQLDMEQSADCTRSAGGAGDDVPEDSWRFLNSGQSAHHDMHCAYCRAMNQELTFVDSFVAKVLDHYRESTAPDSDKAAATTTDPLQKQHAAALASKLAVTKAIVETEMEKRKVHEKLKEMEWHEYQKYYRTVEDKVMQRAIKRAEERIVATSGPHDRRLRELRELERSYNLGGGGAKKKPQKEHHSSPRQGRYQKAIAKDLDRVDDCVIV
ncbi:hypothetical protein BZA70DRAFT_282678 [Myxozyma melibiosi]|uniref:Uncharacterized protein n=1 Tax=Myxozyma melibiosi TaxID=54550 RepID=A0ABR1F132_9ASCO